MCSKSSSPASLRSLPNKWNYDDPDDTIWDMGAPSAEFVENETLLAMEESVHAAYCSRVLEDFTIESDEDGSTDEDNDAMETDTMEQLPSEVIERYGSVRKNLFPVLEQLANTSLVEKVVPIEKKKWGPVLTTTKMVTRNHGCQNVVDKAKELQKRRNLEIPPNFRGFKVARCQGNLEENWGICQNLESFVPRQAFRAVGSKSVEVGSCEGGVAENCMDWNYVMKIPRGFSGPSAEVMRRWGARPDWSGAVQEFSARLLVCSCRLSFFLF